MITQVTGLSSLNPQKGVEQKVANIISARVIKVIIDDQNPETAKAFKDFGGWSTIGCIFFTSLNEPNPNVEFTSNNFALPLFPNVSAVPLKNEIVYISETSTVANLDLFSQMGFQNVLKQYPQSL